VEPAIEIHVYKCDQVAEANAICVLLRRAQAVSIDMPPIGEVSLRSAARGHRPTPRSRLPAKLRPLPTPAAGRHQRWTS